MFCSNPILPCSPCQALLRQKNKEQKRLEAALENERHLRGELEMDLRDRMTQLHDRGMYLSLGHSKNDSWKWPA